MQPRYFDFQAIFYEIYSFFKGLGFVSTSGDTVVFSGYKYIYYLKVVLVFIAAFCTFLAIDFLHRLYVLRRKEAQDTMVRLMAIAPAEEVKNQRWEEVQGLLVSDNESDWKLAIIESDKMLDDLLAALGYQGESIGDKLLAVEKGDMLSLDDAWEAHKYRNRIAHETGFQVTLREARRIIGMYEKVFREYQYI